MEKKGISLAEIQEVPKESLILLSGPPGAGKSTFCHQVVLNGLAMDKPVFYVTTEHGPTEVIGLLSEKGLGELPPSALSFIDAFGETVGVRTSERPDTVSANCEDLNSISMAIARLQERIGRRDALLTFDSLTSPYLFNGEEVFRFIRLCLAKFASEGNSVLALMDEGCGKEEDLGAMMSVADGIIRMEIKENSRTLNVVKHPKVRPTRIEVPIESERVGLGARMFYPGVLREQFRARIAGGETVIRREVGDFVNLFWPNFAHWSGMLWEPKRFPMMTYELNKEDGVMIRDIIPFFPWRWKLLLKLFMPKSFSKVKDMKKMWKMLEGRQPNERTGTIEYLEDISKTDEHYFRLYESSDCWGFENVGTAMASYLPPTAIAGLIKGFEYWQGLERDWNAIETKCIGLGDPYCEWKVVPGEIPELKDSLRKDSQVLERMHDRLMGRLMGFLVDGKPLVERPRSGSDVFLNSVGHVVVPALASERYRTVIRMAGAKAGKEVGEHLIEAGIREDEAVKRVLNLLDYCKVGRVTMDETIRMKESCESAVYRLMTKKREEPSCYFTTGFINGFFTTVKNQHVREVRCVAAGDPYCEWEFR